MSPTLLQPAETPADPVRGWRFECLVNSGYPRREALELSERKDVDLHFAVSLIEQGCDASTALRILL